MKKKILATILLVAFTITFTGCNFDELSFLGTLKTMSKLTEFKFEGSFEAKMNKYEFNENYISPIEPTPALPISKRMGLKKVISEIQDVTTIPEDIMNGDLPEGLDSLMVMAPSLLEGKIEYSGSISKLANKIVFFADSVDAEGLKTPIIKIIFNDKTLLIDKTFLDSFLMEYTDEETVDGVEYGKFNVDDLIKSYFDSMRESFADEPQGMPSYEIDSLASDDYFTGYEKGFDIGMQDGYFGEVTPNEDGGTPDYEAGYDVGYAEGIIEGQIEKQDYIDNADERATTLEMFDTTQAQLIGILDSAYVIDTLTNSQTIEMDEMINTFFKEFSLSAVKKENNSKYVLDMNAGDMIDAVSQTFVYMMDNGELLKSSLITIVNGMSDEQLSLLFSGAETKQSVIDLINEMDTTDTEQIEMDKADFIDIMNMTKTDMNKTIDVNFNYSLEKTGSTSYETAVKMTMKTKEDEENLIAFDSFPFLMDVEIDFNLSINKEGTGDVKVVDTLSLKSGSTASIKLDITDENFVETGIAFATNSDFTNSVNVKAIKQSDGSYTVDLTSLEPGLTYFYKSYTKDESGNIVFSSEVKTFNNGISPATGDKASPWPVVIFIFAAVAIAAALFFLKKKE